MGGEKNIKNKKEILNIVAFCILIEKDGGILNKSPDYILEKFEKYIESKEEDMWMRLFDDKNNFEILKKWAKKWLKRNLDKEVNELLDYEENMEKAKHSESKIFSSGGNYETNNYEDGDVYW